MDEIQSIFNAIGQNDINAYKTYVDRIDINALDNNGLSLLHKVIAYKRPEIAIDLLGHSIDVNIQDSNGQTCLHYLGFFPNLDIANRIIQKNGNIELKDKFGNTPLWYAVLNARGNYDFVELLIQNHANPNTRNNAGSTPLKFAFQIQDKTLLSILGSYRMG